MHFKNSMNSLAVFCSFLRNTLECQINEGMGDLNDRVGWKLPGYLISWGS